MYCNRQEEKVVGISELWLVLDHFRIKIRKLILIKVYHSFTHIIISSLTVTT